MKLSGELDYRIRYDAEHNLFHVKNVFSDEYITPTFIEYVQKLEKENTELKHQLNKNPCVCNTEWHCNDCLEQLIKAKELLKEWLQTSKASGCDNINIVTDTEQFLKDSEVEK